MKRAKHSTEPDPAAAPTEPQPKSRFDGMVGMHFDEDERPSREDRDYGQTIFTRPPVKVPKFLRPKRERRG